LQLGVLEWRDVRHATRHFSVDRRRRNRYFALNAALIKLSLCVLSLDDCEQFFSALEQCDAAFTGC